MTFSLKQFFYCWIVVDILNLLSETKINYWFKHKHKLLQYFGNSGCHYQANKYIQRETDLETGYYLIRYIKQKIIILN